MTGAGGGGFLVLITKEPDMADKIRAVIEEKKVLAPECHIPPTQAKKNQQKKEIADNKQQCFSIADNVQCQSLTK